MTRVKRGYITRRRRNKNLAFASGFHGSHSKQFRAAKQQKQKALTSAKHDRLKQKRNFRCLWIVRINAAVRRLGVPYNKYINCMYKKRLPSNRKTLAQIATLENNSFYIISKNILA
uniref:Large ribosomal subunit protein bL20c n=1 Tax=Ephedra torreyana TaxID=45077 RepID=A0A0F7LU03_9SPER|nr:ribosomal protein L20 [Ephedra torreyana]